MVHHTGAYTRPMPRRPDLNIERVAAVVVPDALVVARNDLEARELSHRRLREAISRDLAVLRTSWALPPIKRVPHDVLHHDLVAATRKRRMTRRAEEGRGGCAGEGSREAESK